MGTFRTEVNIPQAKDKINFDLGLLFMGSCFSNNIGGRLAFLKFNCMANPFGVLYNPISIANSLDLLIDKKQFTASDLGFYNQKWFSFHHHTSFSDPIRETCLNRINNMMQKAAGFVGKMDFLFITFGTARVYEYLKTGQTVSNCHKIPAKEFSHKLLSPEQIVGTYEKLLNKLNKLNDQLKVVFTVSPIRHWKDGPSGNLISKSTLVVSIHQLLGKFKNASYFPAYEIMMDDLRDYRFYKPDMLHPSEVAIDYIWDVFAETYFSENAKSIVRKIEKLKLAVEHKLLDPSSKQSIDFARQNIAKIQQLQKDYPHLDFTAETEYFKGLIDRGR